MLCSWQVSCSAPTTVEKFAISCRSSVGVASVCVTSPPFDQDSNSYSPSSFVCGDRVPNVLNMPSTLVTATGVENGCPSTVTSRPGGLVVNVMVDFLGRMSTESFPLPPFESVTVKIIRYQTLSDVSPSLGIEKEPLLTPSRGGSSCLCVS